MSRSRSVIALSLTTILALPTGASLFLWLYARASPSYNARHLPSAIPGHKKSLPMSLVNPHHYPGQGGSISFRIPLRQLKPGISDEEVLARFTKGFFGGWIFAPERWILCRTKLSLTNFKVLHGNSLNPSSQVSLVPVWRLPNFSSSKFPPVGTLLFGTFLLLDCSKTSNPLSQMAPTLVDSHRPNAAFIEFVAGSDLSTFACSHRFEVERSNTVPEEGAVVNITFSSIAFNPMGGGKGFSDWLTQFHVFYSKLLFADGIKEVMRD